MRRRIGALLLGLATVLGGPAAVPAIAADNHPPVAVDDPAVPGCQSAGLFGGAFPIPEDFSYPAEDDWFAWLGACLPTANDSDPEGNPLILELVGQPAHGEATWFQMGANALLRYRAEPDWSTLPGDVEGGDWFSDAIPYRLWDGTAYSNTASYRVWLAPINDAPTFTPGAALVEGDAHGPQVSVPWASGMDAGPYESYQTVSFTVETDTNNAPGMFSVLPAIDHDGTLTFTPGTEPGLATITVTAQDDGGLEDWDMGAWIAEQPADSSASTTFEIVVWPFDGPMANDDEATLAEDTPTLIDVLANDDGNGGPVQITSTTDGALGTVEIIDTGVVYTPNPDANGSDAFTYTIEDEDGATDTATVEVTVDQVNDAPVAVDDAFTVVRNASTAPVDVLGNDSDVDGDELEVQSAAPSDHGTVTLNGGVVRYRPDTGFSGTDTFQYTAEDGNGGSDPATVTVTVVANQAPVAADDQSAVDEDDVGTVDVLANDDDPDGQGLAITATTDGTKGATEVVEGGVRYIPDADANGADTFMYTIEDADGATDTATVSVTIAPVNDDPVAAQDMLTVAEKSGPTVVDVLANDTDADGDELVVEAVGTASHGTVALADGDVTYEPQPGYVGSDAFEYTVGDGNGGSDTATITVTVDADTVAPLVTTGAVEVAGARLPSDGVGLRFRWTANDAIPGVATQVVQERHPSGSWRLVDRPAPDVSSVVLDIELGDTAALRVRATDARANTSAWAAWPEVEALVRQETSSAIDWSGTWKRGEARGDSGGATSWTGGSGRRATIEARVRAIAWVGRRQPDGGRAEVWVDGVKVATVDTDAGSMQRRAILFRTAWPSRGSHTVQVRSLGGGRLDVDAFVILR